MWVLRLVCFEALLVGQVFSQELPADACERLTEGNLGTTDLSSTGLVSAAIITTVGDGIVVSTRLIPGSIHIVCEAQHEIRDRYRYTSALFSYVCTTTGNRTLAFCDNSAVITAQLTLSCVDRAWSLTLLGTSASPLTPNPVATASTSLASTCSLCFPPDNTFVNFLQLVVSEVTHCVECDCAVGLGRCFGSEISDQTCCNYFSESSCVENCPLGQVSGTNFVCEFNGSCELDLDLTWSIEWPNTPSGSTSTQQCPGGNSTGQATRLCNSDGEWENPNVLSCQQMEFMEIEVQASDLLSGTLDSATIVENTVVITQQLEVITEADTTPLLPSSLNTTNQVLTAVINALEQVGNDIVTTVTNELIVDVFSNILERNNSITWMALQENTGGSQVLLSNVERFSVLVARSQSGNGLTEPVRISRPNIAISAKLYDGSQMDELKKDLTFPQQEDLANYSFSAFVPAQISIPPGFLQERLSQQNGSSLPVSFILLQNLEAFLPSSARGLDNNTGSASVVISSQVGDRGFTGASVSLKEFPILLNFSFQSVQVNESTVQYHCIFWNFSNPVGNGGWITDGVNTVGNASDGAGRSTVNCTSSHLTSFAVLFTAVRTNETRGDEFALELVSYIGCAISIISLLLAVIFYLVQGKTLFTSVHNFVHLNLCISLLLSYSVFVAGVSTAVGDTVGCAFVAALLHYLFLSSFCWILCEGVMLYLMLVVVFSQLAKTWWFFLLLGYVTPIPIVAVTVGIRWQYYEALDVCWLPLADGTIFGFIVPVLVIMLINFVFIVIALRVILKNQKGRAVRTGRKDSQSGKQKSIARSILLATVVLLPLLGLTWLFGLLVIVATSPVFDWLFTILNSLQGLAILFFHVIRSDKVWSRIGPHFSSASKWFSTHFGHASRKFRSMTGSSAYTNKSKSISKLEDTGLGTLRSTPPSDSTLKQVPSSSLSFTNPQSQYHSDLGKEDFALSKEVPMETMDLQEVEDESIYFKFKFKGATVVVYPNAGVSTAEL